MTALREVDLTARSCRIASGLALLVGITSALARLFRSWFVDLESYGFHDWDSSASYRALTVDALREGVLPFWDPYLCGGFPAWGYGEGAPNLVSPLLPLYLLAPLQLAIRVEPIAMTVVGLAGAYALASTVTRSIALRGGVAVVFALNGRWALQISVGHAWFFAYALTPWVLLAYYRALSPRATYKPLVAGAVLLALQGYMGGIYPLPHTALAVALYGLARALFSRSATPIWRGLVMGALGVSLFAPKLLPILATMQRFPRLIASSEAIGPATLWSMMIERSSGRNGPPVPVPIHGWHEWGIYLGWAGVAALLLSAIAVKITAARAYLITGTALFMLGFGSFSSWAPWSILHELPLFASQHVPSRFFVPAVLFLALAAAAVVARRLDVWMTRRPWIDMGLAALVGWLALDLTSVGARSTGQSLYLRAPVIEPGREFHHVAHTTVGYTPAHAWGGAALLSRLNNEGFLACAAVPDGAEPRGAIAVDAPDYPGEIFLADQHGTARIAARTVNGVDVDVATDAPDLLVFNMNFDPGWQANGAPALDRRHAVATRVEAGSHRIRFRYVPPGLFAGIAMALATLCALLAYIVKNRTTASPLSRARALSDAPTR